MGLCSDTPEEIRRGRSKHGARAVLLSDADLAVTDRYALRNPGNITPPIHGRIWNGMPIPTTFLVDAAGCVRWVDQARDYQVRSDPERVLEALRKHLD